MINVVWLFIATVTVHVAGSKWEATEGDNVTIHFNTGLERVDEVKIMFEGESERKRLLAQYCSPESFPICDPVETSHLQVEGGNVSMIFVNVDISRSGLYTARVITANKMYEKHQFPPVQLLHTRPPSQNPPAPLTSSGFMRYFQSSSSSSWFFAASVDGGRSCVLKESKNWKTVLVMV
ncbi:hypothetical protein R3I94_017579 [Phoxinus phoxinus]